MTIERFKSFLRQRQSRADQPEASDLGFDLANVPQSFVAESVVLVYLILVVVVIYSAAELAVWLWDNLGGLLQ